MLPRAEATRANYELAPPSSPYGDDREYVFEKFAGHRFDADGHLELRVRWFGFSPQADTWRKAYALPAEAVEKVLPSQKAQDSGDP
ncbi:hypothetical protein MMPV_010025 [Pyropia vietnamensis]